MEARREPSRDQSPSVCAVCPVMEWSGRAPAPPASEAGQGRQSQGSRHVTQTQQRNRRDRHRYRQSSFHVVGQDKRGEIVLRQKWSRQVEARLANLSPCLIGMEACVGARHLSRKLQTLGHDARLMPAIYVRPYSKGQKNDYRDAEAIAEAVQRISTSTLDGSWAGGPAAPLRRALSSTHWSRRFMPVGRSKAAWSIIPIAVSSTSRLNTASGSPSQLSIRFLASAMASFRAPLKFITLGFPPTLSGNEINRTHSFRPRPARMAYSIPS